MIQHRSRYNNNDSGDQLQCRNAGLPRCAFLSDGLSVRRLQEVSSEKRKFRTLLSHAFVSVCCELKAGRLAREPAGIVGRHAMW